MTYRYFLQNSITLYKCGSRVESRSTKLKTTHSHDKILSKLTEIYWRWLSMTGNYSVQISVARPTCGPHIKSRTLKIKPHVHTIILYQILFKFVEDDSVWVWLDLHGAPCQKPHHGNKTSHSHYKSLSKLTVISWRWLGMQSSVARTTYGLHVKSGATKFLYI